MPSISLVAFAFVCGLTACGIVATLMELRGTGTVRFVEPYVSRRAILRSLSNRMTVAMQRRGDDWKVVHEHTSAPIEHGTLKAQLQAR